MERRISRSGMAEKEVRCAECQTLVWVPHDAKTRGFVCDACRVGRAEIGEQPQPFSAAKYPRHGEYKIKES